MNIIIFGPPCSGKGTQSKLLSGFVQLSTGEMLRQEIKNESVLGKEIAPIIARGGLVSDDIVLRMIKEKINVDGNFIFDGFPRTLNQAKLLENSLNNIGQKIDLLIYLRVEPEDMSGRVAVRYLEQKRPEDHPEAFKNRLKDFYDHTLPIIEYYRDSHKDKLRIVDGTADIKTVSSAIATHVGWA